MANRVHTTNTILPLLFLAFLQVRTFLADIDLHIEPAKSVQFKAIGSSLHLKCTNAFNATKRNVSLEWNFFNKSLGNEVILSRHNRTTTAVVNINKLSYHDDGIYTCVAKDTASHTKQAEKSVQIVVGDPPPEPPCPVLHTLFGVPPVAGTVTYVLPTAAPSAYPLTIKLLLSHTSMDNFCDDSLHPEFQIAVEKNISFRGEAGNLTFQADISSMLKRLFPPKNCRNGYIDCDRLCGTVLVSNRFGCRYCRMPMMWNVDTKAECGKVDKLEVQTNKSSVVVSWKTPKYMINSKQSKLFFSIWCRPKCGRRHMKLKKTSSGNYTYTVHSLIPNNLYNVSVSCSIYDYTIKPSSTATITAKTLEDVPSEAPIIEQLRWIPDEQSDDKWTALIVWKELKKEVLRGKLEKYKVSFQNLNIPLAEPRKEQVSADRVKLEIPGLSMANYNFTIEACTRAGCGKEHHHILKASVAVKHSSPTQGPQNKNEKVNTITIVMCSLAGGAIIFVLTIAWFCRKSDKRGDLPVIPNVMPGDSDEDGKNDSTPKPDDDVYASVNPAFSVSMDNLKVEDKEDSSPSKLSRTSSSSTCSTVA